ncbi:MAG: META domain-containing protein [Bacteroidales bacterium]
MKQLVMALAIFATIGFTSCNCCKKAAKTQTVDVKTLNGAWNVVELNGKAIQTSENGPFLELNFAENRLHGKGGCNITNGNFVLSAVNASAISFPAVMTTRMACPDMATESAYLKALNEVAAVKAAGKDRYAFVNKAGETLFVVAPRK